MARSHRSTISPQESTRPIVRVALYARVSTFNNQDPEMQLSELREYAGRRGWQIVEEFTDQGVSGCKESRPALNRLMSDASRRRFDTILVWKIDRFGRSLKHLVNALAELASLGIAFVSLRDNLDLSTPSGRLMFQIIGAMAEFERALIQERVCAGIRNAKAKGLRVGRPRVIVDALRIADLRAQGRSWGQIQAEMRVSKGTAQRAFANLPKTV
jgi:DNA invertase Pin-like site-specific DNA recombinase